MSFFPLSEGEVVLQEATMFMAHLVLNTSIPMCHLCFSPGRDEVPESMIMWHGGKNVPAMFYKCRAEHNSILPEVH